MTEPEKRLIQLGFHAAFVMLGFGLRRCFRNASMPLTDELHQLAVYLFDVLLYVAVHRILRLEIGRKEHHPVHVSVWY